MRLPPRGTRGKTVATSVTFTYEPAMPRKPRKRPDQWTARELGQLGRVLDSVLARRSGRTIRAVVAMRESRRIALPTGPRRWTARELRLLRTMPDAEFARRFKRTLPSVQNERNYLGLPYPARRLRVLVLRPQQPPIDGRVSDGNDVPDLRAVLRRSRDGPARAIHDGLSLRALSRALEQLDENNFKPFNHDIDFVHIVLICFCSACICLGARS